jgi:integrase
MAILAECPICHRRQSLEHKRCKCGEDLDRAKRSNRVKYWHQYRLPGGRQKKELVGLSIEKARDAEGKRRSQKRENRIFDILPETKLTFNELQNWYLGLDRTKALAYFKSGSIEDLLNRFTSVFGGLLANQLTAVDIENLQARLRAEHLSDSYIDQIIGAARTMVNMAFNSDLVAGDALKSFRKKKKLLRRNANARKRVLSPVEFDRLMAALSKSNRSSHLKAIVAAAHYTGMRRGEILGLTWDRVDLKKRVIRLEATDTKDREARTVPICRELLAVLMALPTRLTASEEDNHVFKYAGEAVGDIREGLQRACKDAGIAYGRKAKNGFVFHDLRHGFNTNMRRAGVPESVIMAITGHSTREMFDRYNTIDDQDKLQAVERLGRIQSSDEAEKAEKAEKAW